MKCRLLPAHKCSINKRTGVVHLTEAVHLTEVVPLTGEMIDEISDLHHHISIPNAMHTHNRTTADHKEVLTDLLIEIRFTMHKTIRLNQGSRIIVRIRMRLNKIEIIIMLIPNSNKYQLDKHNIFYKSIEDSFYC